MNTNEFRIIINMKKLIYSLDHVLISFPNKEKILKDKIRDTSFEVLELMKLANIKKEKVDLQEKIISKISMIDFYLEFSFQKKYISERQCKNLCEELSKITKMMYGWIKNGA